MNADCPDLHDETPGCGICLAPATAPDGRVCLACGAWLRHEVLRLREWLVLLERFDAFCALRDLQGACRQSPRGA